MAFNAGSIVAHLKLDSKKYRAELAKSQKQTKGFSKSLGAMGAIAGTIVAGGLIAATGALVKFTGEGARLVDMERAFENMASAAGTSSERVISDVRAITKSLSDRDITQTANNLEILNIGLERMPRFIEIARAASIGLGKDMKWMIESLALGSARQSRLILDNLGILVSVDDANRKYAEGLGLTVKQLTDQQRRTAFMNEVMRQGDRIIDKVGATTESTSEKTDHLTASFANLFDTFKKGLAKSDLPDVLNEIAKGIDSITASEKRREELGLPTGLRGLLDPRALIPGVVPLARLTDPDLGRDVSLTSAEGDMAARRPGILLAERAAEEHQKAALALQAAAKAHIQALTKPRGFGGFTPGETMRTGPTGGPAQLDFTPIDIPELQQSGQEFEDAYMPAISTVDEGLRALGNSFQDMFHEIAVGSDNAGRAFFSGMMGGLAGVMSAAGDMFIQTGLGMIALGSLSPYAAIAAGIALKSISGLFSGVASKNAPVPSSRQVDPREPERTKFKDKDDEGPRIVFHIDNFVGNQAWADNFMRRMNRILRSGGYQEVFFNAP